MEKFLLKKCFGTVVVIYFSTHRIATSPNLELHFCIQGEKKFYYFCSLKVFENNKHY